MRKEDEIMKIKKKVIGYKKMKFFIKIKDKEIGKAFLYILHNDLHMVLI